VILLHSVSLLPIIAINVACLNASKGMLEAKQAVGSKKAKNIETLPAFDNIDAGTSMQSCNV